MITKDTPICRYLLAVDAPEGSVFTVYTEDLENKIRFQQTIVWVSTALPLWAGYHPTTTDPPQG